MVSPGKKIKIEKLPADEGSMVAFDKVLLFSDAHKTEVGKPYVEGIKVEGSIVSQGRAKKVIVFKYRPKARHRTKKGHRQHFSEVMVERIVQG